MGFTNGSGPVLCPRRDGAEKVQIEDSLDLVNCLLAPLFLGQTFPPRAQPSLLPTHKD